MMASDSNRFPKWSINLFLFLFYLSWAISSVSHARTFPLERPACQDGTYQHQGKTCCRCAAGQRLKAHCSEHPDDRVCEHCEPGKTYSSTDNYQTTCELCTSCTQINANLEVEEACTIARDTVCRCKKDHYCDNGKETCRFCRPCEKCDVEGIKVACTASNNTVCKDKESGGVNLAAVLVPVFLVILIIIALVLYCWKKKYLTQLPFGETTEVPGSPTADMEPLRGVDLSSYLPDIAAVLGWTVMRNVALSSGKTVAAIQYVEENHPKDSEERTFQLLTQWVEQQGSGASLKLIEILRHMGKNGIAEKVMDIIKRNECPGGNADG